MKTYICNSLADFYKQVYTDMQEAPLIKPRGQLTKEILYPQIVLTNPKACFMRVFTFI
jgi:hypothetical protein